MFCFVQQVRSGVDPLDQWTLRNPVPTPKDLHSVVFGGDLFVAGGDALLTSPDAITWTQHDLPDGHIRIKGPER